MKGWESKEIVCQGLEQIWVQKVERLMSVGKKGIIRLAPLIAADNTIILESRPTTFGCC